MESDSKIADEPSRRLTTLVEESFKAMGISRWEPECMDSDSKLLCAFMILCFINLVQASLDPRMRTECTEKHFYDRPGFNFVFVA